MLLKTLRNKWKQYKYRFVPWIALNLKDRSVRSVPDSESDKVLQDVDIEQFLLHLFTCFEDGTQCDITASEAEDPWKSQKLSIQEQCVLYRSNLKRMKNSVGFVMERKPSLIPAGGTGVFVTGGQVPPGTVVSMYPGTVYRGGEPIMFQSLANPFIFRCIDAILIDGNDKNLSKYIYRSCSQRDRHGPHFTCDMSWLTQYPTNPLAIGQYVNNQSKQFPANVVYQEFDIPFQFPFHLRKYIPNINYCSSIHDGAGQGRLTRVVVLVSLREIEQGEELFSSYFTVVH